MVRQENMLGFCDASQVGKPRNRAADAIRYLCPELKARVSD